MTHGIADWVRTGRLHRLHRGVYAFGHDRLRLEGRWLAAVMACGPGAVLSHRDAAQLWELRRSNAAVIDVTVPSQNGRIRRRGIRVHRLGGCRRRRSPCGTGSRSRRWRARCSTSRTSSTTGAEEGDHRGGVHGPLRPDRHQCCRSEQPGPARRKAHGGGRGSRHRTRSPLEERFLGFMERHGSRSRRPGSGSRAMRSTSYGRERASSSSSTDCRAHHARRLQCRSIARPPALAERAPHDAAHDEALEDEAAVLDDLAQAGVSVPSWPRASS